MDAGLFERLLHEDESNTLDFKAQQYRFTKATAREKSEILKDILGFANAWRRTDAFILIGVEEARGGRSKVAGVSEHLDDHSLQQFVHSRTNRPVRFAYEAFEWEERQVGVICIQQTERPVYLEADYGKLRRHEVYVRRGSSTDPGTPATPDEVARMASQVEAGASPALVVSFAEPDGGEVVGEVLSVRGEYCRMPAAAEMPTLASSARGYSLANSFTHTNADYYRKFAEYVSLRRMCFRSRVVLLNQGSVEARKVLVEFTVRKGEGIELLSWVPQRPRRTYSTLDFVDRSRDFGPSSIHTNAGDLYIEEDGEKYRMHVNFLDLQPGRRVASEDFYVVARASGVHKLVGQMYAANLPRAERIELRVVADIGRTSMTVDELVALAEE